MSYETNTDLESTPATGAPDSAFGHLIDALNAAGSVLIAAVMLLMCADVLLRNLANRPIDGVAELVATSIVMIVFLQLPATLRHGRMSRADLFIDPFIDRRPRAGKRLRALFSAAGIFACGVIAYASWRPLLRSWTEDEFLGVEGLFTFPIWPMRALVVLGAALAAVQYLLLVIQDIRESLAAAGGDAPNATRKPGAQHE
ncbi:TRAP transporter small permease [Leptospira sp. 96542]|nr:TRAP transporter small permease [Leptospira sp. 96542]